MGLLSDDRFSRTKVGEKLETELQFSEGAKEGAASINSETRTS